MTALVGATDLFATCAEMAGLDPDEDLPSGLVTDSISLMPYLEQPGCAPLRHVLYSELFSPNLATEPDIECRAVRGERYKLIHRIKPAHRWEFFDLWRDPHETRNLMLQEWTIDEWRAFLNLSSAIDEVRGS